MSIAQIRYPENEGRYIEAVRFSLNSDILACLIALRLEGSDLSKATVERLRPAFSALDAQISEDAQRDISINSVRLAKQEKRSALQAIAHALGIKDARGMKLKTLERLIKNKVAIATI